MKYETCHRLNTAPVPETAICTFSYALMRDDSDLNSDVHRRIYTDVYFITIISGCFCNQHQNSHRAQHIVSKTLLKKNVCISTIIEYTRINNKNHSNQHKNKTIQEETVYRNVTRIFTSLTQHY
jgi:hypothetical protein